jgi:peroxiredoxin
VVVLVGLRRHRLGLILRPRDGIAIGERAPSFRLELVGGGELALEDLRGRRVLLVFSHPDCPPCQALAPRLDAIAREQSGVDVLVVSRGDQEVNRRKVAALGVTYRTVLQGGWATSRAYATFVLPSAYLIDEHGAIASPLAMGDDAILELIDRVSGATASA